MSSIFQAVFKFFFDFFSIFFVFARFGRFLTVKKPGKMTAGHEKTLRLAFGDDVLPAFRSRLPGINKNELEERKMNSKWQSRDACRLSSEREMA